MSANKITLQTVVTIIPVLSACLYLMGATYHLGYLNEFGIEDSLFQLATDRSLLMGFLSLISAVKPVFYICMMGLALVFMTIVAAVLSSTERAKRLQAIIQMRFRIPRFETAPSPSIVNLVDRSASLYMYITTLAFLFLGLVMIALLSFGSGQKQAKQEIEQFSAGKGIYVIFEEGKTSRSIKARQIFCGSTHCAFWLGQEAVVLRHEDISRITVRKH